MSAAPVPMPRVLLVEDESGLRFTTAATLELEEMVVVEAQDGMDGLEKLEAALAPGGQPFDVVVTDVAMPRLGGVELLARLRERRHTLPVVLVTAFANDGELQRAYGLGAFTVVAKPFDVAALASVVRRALTRPRVLVVDDHAAEATALAGVLEQAGLPTAVAFDGPTALGAVAAGGIDVAVVDLKMPGMDGVELLRQVRAHGHSLDVVSVSGDLASPLVHAAVVQGAQVCLAKPFDPGQLLQTIARLRGTKRSNGPWGAR